MSDLVRIMPLGDSITVGFRDESPNGGYRGPLFQKLIDAKLTVEFVGGETGDPNTCPKHEGHSGWTTFDIYGKVFSFLIKNPPDVVLLHIGTNDVLQQHPVDQIIGKLSQILDEVDLFARFFHKDITVVLAQIINAPDPNPPQNSKQAADVATAALQTTKLNAAIKVMADARIEKGDRLLLVNFENALSFAEDIFTGDLPLLGILEVQVHPKHSGYVKMAAIWFDALIHVLGNWIIPQDGYTLDVSTGLAVGQDGILKMTSVVDQEYWKPLISIGDMNNATFHPGAPVAMAKQTNGVLTALAVNTHGELAVASVGGAGIWKPPVGIITRFFNQGTYIAMAKQTDNVLTALAVDAQGVLMFTWVPDLGIWQPATDIPGVNFPPGAPVALAKQTDNYLTALAVDNSQRLMHTSVEGQGIIWTTPVAIEGATFKKGTHVAMAKQTDYILTALAVNDHGNLMVTSVADRGDWQTPVGISSAMFLPGAPVAMAKQTDDVLTALAVDTSGRLMVTSVPGQGHWQDTPVPISDPIFQTGAYTHVAMGKQTGGILTALAIDKYGRLVVASVGGLGNWQKPVAISEARFPPGAPVAMAKQIDGVKLAAFLNEQPPYSGSPLAHRVGQLTGDGVDVEYRRDGFPPRSVMNFTESNDVVGVDLGTNTEIDNNIVFFFGDTLTNSGGPKDQTDWVAFHRIDNLNASNLGFHLESVNAQGKYFPFTVKGIGPLGISTLGQAQTPTGAFAYQGKGSDGKESQTYVFAFYDPDDASVPPNQKGSLLTKSVNPIEPSPFNYLFNISTFDNNSARFFQVAPWVVNNADFPGVFPSSVGDGLVLLGQGGPANSVHAAWMPLQKGSDPDLTKISYYRGTGARRRWSSQQENAKDLFFTIGYTSLSLAWIPEIKRWLLLYSLASPGAIPLNPNRDAPVQHNPNGPVVARLGKTPYHWSDEITIFDPLRDNALGRFMHRPFADNLYDRVEKDNKVKPFLPPSYSEAYGGEVSYAYGPFLINRFRAWDAATQMLTIHYLLSTYRPYQIHVMKSQFQIPPD